MVPAPSQPPAVTDAAAATPHEARCRRHWERLRRGDTREVSLESRCRLAGALASAAVFTLSMTRTRWSHLEGDALDAVVLLGSRERAALIGDRESCPRIEATRFYAAGRDEDTVPLDLRGAVDALTPIELWLYLPTAAAERSACTATFRSPLNQSVAPLVPPTKISPGVSVAHRPSIWFNSAPAPELVVEVTMGPDDTFTVTRQSIETGVMP